MKKLVFLFVAFAAISFASCGNKTQEPAATVAEDTLATDTLAADSLSADSVSAESDTTIVAE